MAVLINCWVIKMSELNSKANRELIERLIDTAGSGNIHHAYIFEGPLTANKKGIALRFAQALMCERAPGKGCGICSVCRNVVSEKHIDMTFVKAEASKSSKSVSIKDADIERLIRRLKSKPYEASRNIAIIQDADTMTHKAANRLLKTLEEPPVGTVIMILSENITNLPITIRSRCVHFRVMADMQEKGGYADLAHEMVTQFARGAKYYEIKKQIENAASSREEAYLFLDSLEDEYRERLVNNDGSLRKEKIFCAVEEIEKTRNKIKRNVIVQYALKELALALGC